jgi:hypothetical protein
MSPELDSRIRVLEAREHDVREILNAINTKLDTLTRAFDQRPNCPAPGSCIALERELSLLKQQQHKHSEEIEKLLRWQMYVFGACGAIVVGWTVGITILKLLSGG